MLLLLVYVGAWAVLRALWPDLLRGWRRWVLLGGSVMSLAVWLFPLLAGPHVELPAALRILAVGWSISAIIVVLAGTPIALLRKWVDRKSPELVPSAPLASD
ncbi:metallophosphoesterase, partial [Myxococcus llanfairpwllgwyngyllgogerychwyrndrobwllllantysiliogogogochensis]